MNNIAQNLKTIRDKKGYSQAEMADFIGVPKSTYASYEYGKAEPDIDKILTICDKFSIEFFDLVRGNVHLKLKKQTAKIHENVQLNVHGNVHPNAQNDAFNTHVNEPQTPFKNTRIPLLVTVDQHGNDNIVFVPVKAQAGYLLGYGDPEYIETLPAFQMPGLRTGTFRMFEVQGVSMAPVLSNTDRVICEYVNSMDEIRENRIHVVVHAGGIAVKRLINRIKEDGCIYMKSDTLHHRADYPITPIDPADIKEIWYVRMRITSDLREPSEVYTRITELELKMQAVALKLGLK